MDTPAWRNLPILLQALRPSVGHLAKRSFEAMEAAVGGFCKRLNCSRRSTPNYISSLPKKVTAVKSFQYLVRPRGHGQGFGRVSLHVTCGSKLKKRGRWSLWTQVTFGCQIHRFGKTGPIPTDSSDSKFKHHIKLRTETKVTQKQCHVCGKHVGPFENRSSH